MNEAIQKLFLEIAEGAYAQKPPGEWDFAEYKFKAIGRMFEQRGFFRAKNKDWYFVLEKSIRPLFEKLRIEMAKIGRLQPWYTAILTLTPEGKFKFDFDYDHLPEFEIMPDVEKWMDEFREYPSPELQAQIQDWIDGTVQEKDWKLMVDRLSILSKK